MNPNDPQRPGEEQPATLPMPPTVVDLLTVAGETFPQASLNARKALDRLIGTSLDLASAARRNRNRLALIARQCVPLLAILRDVVSGRGHIVTRDAVSPMVAELDELIRRLESLQ